LKKIKKKFKKKIFTISAVTGKGIRELSEELFKLVQKAKEVKEKSKIKNEK